LALLRNSVALLAALLAAPPAALTLLMRPAWREGLGERLGGGRGEDDAGVWLHGASVGEAQLLARLAAGLESRGRCCHATLTTLGGRATWRRVRAGEPGRLAPLDHPWCVSAALGGRRPDALVLVETELWPALIAGTHRRGIPIALVSGRISDRSWPRYQTLRAGLRPTLQRIDRIGARSELDAQRFVELGAARGRVSVVGDLKLEPPPAPPVLAPDLARVLQGPPILVAGSTHAGEEVAVLRALAHCESQGMEAALVLAPRHLDRLAEVERLISQSGRATRRRSALGDASLAAGEVLVLDSLGELPALWPRACAAFVGGTLAPVGGHNLLEPVMAGRPVCFGPNVANVRESARLLEQTGAGVCVRDAAALAELMADWLRTPDTALASGSRGAAALARHAGSLDRSLALIDEAIAHAAASSGARP
jgi:3-deoxy-D-manno-octulosonic-acid transferase